MTGMANQATIADRRRAVLKCFRVPTVDAWGIGLLICAPVRRTDSKGGLKFRFLPIIHVLEGGKAMQILVCVDTVLTPPPLEEAEGVGF